MATKTDPKVHDEVAAAKKNSGDSKTTAAKTGGGRGWTLCVLWMSVLIIVVAIGMDIAFPTLLAAAKTRLGLATTSPNDTVISTSPEDAAGQSCQGLDGKKMIDDCRCAVSTVERLNRGVLYPILERLVKQPFFKFYKVNLWCNCPFWKDDGMCFLKDCSVCECGEDEVPKTFRKKEEGLLPADDPACKSSSFVEDPKGLVDRTLNGLKKWYETEDNPWTADDESVDDDMIYVNLQLNPEKYTGYKGDSARKIWQAIYAESCFKDGVDDACTERRVFYRLMSGLHSAITIHVASEFLIDEKLGLWGPNWKMMWWGVAKFPERVQNLHFTYLFVLRALSKAGDYLTHADYSTGSEAEDRETLELMKELVDNRDLKAACPKPFDEAQLWKGKEGPQLKQELQKHFRNISHMMDCVGCEKCRLWGKLQMLGLGTALKILFCTDERGEFQQVKLQRNEVIALVNTLGRFSEALKWLGELPPDISSANANHQSGNVHIKSTSDKNNQRSAPS